MADDDPAWRPTDFRSNLFGCEAGLRFPTAKLLDLAPHEDMLEASVNPFAAGGARAPEGAETHGDPAGRHAWKLGLVRGLYERGFSLKDVRELFRVIDWSWSCRQSWKTCSGKKSTGFKRRDVCHSSQAPSEWAAERAAQGHRSGVESAIRREDSG